MGGASLLELTRLSALLTAPFLHGGSGSSLEGHARLPAPWSISQVTRPQTSHFWLWTPAETAHGLSMGVQPKTGYALRTEGSLRSTSWSK